MDAIEIHTLTGSIQKACLIFIPLALLIKTGLHILKGFTGDMNIHFQSIGSAILLWLLVATYPEVMGKLQNVCDFFVAMVAKPVDDPVTEVSKSMAAGELVTKAANANKMTVGATHVGNGSVWGGIGEIFSAISSQLISQLKDSGEQLLMMPFALAASISRMVIEAIRTILLQFLICVGPIAISLSIVDGFGNVSRHWLSKLVSVYCWSLTLNILDHTIIFYFHQITLVPPIAQLSGIPVTQTPHYLVDQAIVGILYAMVPWLTSWYLGGINAGDVLSHTSAKVYSIIRNSATVTASGLKSIAKKN